MYLCGVKATMKIWIKETRSTNTLLSSWSRWLPDGTAVIARSQSAGRGQRGNSWEAEPGKNLTTSILLKCRDVDIRESYYLSEAVALATVDLLNDCGIQADVKWPNDIYVDNRKIAGILIENQLNGTKIERTIAGIGLNVNQTVWRSDAPNPVSIAQCTAREWDVAVLVDKLQQAILYRLDMNRTELHNQLMSHLWRRDGFYDYHDELLHEDIKARIVAIASSGQITMELTDGSLREYMFKEVSVIV